MRFGFILLALVAAATAVPVYQRAADHDLLKKQQDAIHLLEHITQDLPNQELYNLGLNYDIQSNYQQYHEPATVQYYVGLVQSGHAQPKGTVYSNSVSHLRKEVALLTRVFLSAKDYPIFLQTAAWARVHVNQGQFVKAFIAAILQREDTAGVIPPPLYEIFPQHYVDSRILQQAQNIYVAGSHVEGQNVVIPVNYTDYLPLGEQQLSYFTGDIGLNAYYAYISLAGYMTPQQQHQNVVGYQQIHGSNYESGHHIGHGSYYYYLHQQLLALYNLNRLTTGLGPIQNVDYENVEAPFQAHLHHMNGLEYPARPGQLQTSQLDQDLVKNVYALEKRLLDAIDSGHVITPQQQFLSLYHPQGLNILGDLIEGTGRSVNPRYYGSLQAAARQLLGHTPEFQNIWDYSPSALELSESAVRDPAFYQLYNRIMKLFHRYQQSLPAYQYDDLVMPGVTIEKVSFPNLVTYFDQYNVDLDGGYVHGQQEHQPKIKAQFQRLNHQQYQYQVVVQSNKAYTNAVVRVYLGPKFDHNGLPIDINQHRSSFVELDQFVHNLVEGQNIIVRNSHQAPSVSQDYPSVHQIKTYVDSAIRSQNPFYITEPQQVFGFPDRLSLPKGTIGGYPLQVFVIISPNVENSVPYGPVVPAEWKTYQQHQFQVVSGEQYEQYSQQGQQQQQQQHQGIHYGGHQTLEVLPHYQHNGIYGNQIGKLQAYYGNYLYMRYPGQYPLWHSHHVSGQSSIHQTGGYPTGVFQQQGIYGQQYPVGQQQVFGQHGIHGQQGIHQGQQGIQQGQEGHYIHQGQHYQGQQFQGQQYQGQQHQGQQYQSQHHQGQQQQQVVGETGQYVQHAAVQHGQVPQQQGQQHSQGHQYQQAHGAQHEGIEISSHQQGWSQQGHGIHGVTGIYSGVAYPSGVAGGQVNVAEQSQNQIHQVEYMKQYYGKKHISQIIGGAVSLDNKPLGYPLERPLSASVLYVPNIHVTDVTVQHFEQLIEGVH